VDIIFGHHLPFFPAVVGVLHQQPLAQIKNVDMIFGHYLPFFLTQRIFANH
jgi:hypothetical protein